MWPRDVARPVMRSVVRHSVPFCMHGVQPPGVASHRILRSLHRSHACPVRDEPAVRLRAEPSSSADAWRLMLGIAASRSCNWTLPSTVSPAVKSAVQAVWRMYLMRRLFPPRIPIPTSPPTTPQFHSPGVGTWCRQVLY